MEALALRTIHYDTETRVHPSWFHPQPTSPVSDWRSSESLCKAGAE